MPGKKIYAASSAISRPWELAGLNNSRTEHGESSWAVLLDEGAIPSTSSIQKHTDIKYQYAFVGDVQKAYTTMLLILNDFLKRKEIVMGDVHIISSFAERGNEAAQLIKSIHHHAVIIDLIPEMNEIGQWRWASPINFGRLKA